MQALPRPYEADGPGGSDLDQRNGIVKTKVTNSTPGLCWPMPAFDM
jgi:hypothetical protein